MCSLCDSTPSVHKYMVIDTKLWTESIKL